LICDSYLIDKKVLSLESVFIGENKSKITKTNGIFFSKLSVHDLLDKACMRYGSSFQGRKEATKKLMKYNKTPIGIKPNVIAAFPTKSIDHPECVWIFNHPFKVEVVGRGQSQITFIDGTSIIVSVSMHVILKQQQRLHSTMGMYHMLLREKRNSKFSKVKR